MQWSPLRNFAVFRARISLRRCARGIVHAYRARQVGGPARVRTSVIRGDGGVSMPGVNASWTTCHKAGLQDMLLSQQRTDPVMCYRPSDAMLANCHA